MFQVHVPGIPYPQGSKRHVGNGVLVEANATVLKPWRAAVTATMVEVADGLTFHSGVEVELVFVFPRLRSHYRSNGDVKPTAPLGKATRPDLDKLVRAVLDAITDSGVWLDDAQVVRLVAMKWYGDNPGVRISISEEEE